MEDMSATDQMTVHELLDQLREQATSEADKGRRFERLMAAFFRADPTFSAQFSQVWAWSDWPGRGGRPDTGIDLVAEDAHTGENIAIQCKFYGANTRVSKKDVDSFISASGTRDFARRIIVDTSTSWGGNAEHVLRQQDKPIRRLSLEDLEYSLVDWTQFSWSAPEQLVISPKKQPRKHQREAIDAVTEQFAEHERGKLIMACGTGKTFTSLKLAEEYVGAGGSVLFLVPSISLLSQTIREWADNSELSLDMMAVCSDPKSTQKTTGGDSADISVVDLALPATTDIPELRKRWERAAGNTGSMTVVFSTYQSIEVVAQAQREGGLGEFDLIICDEAHRTTGAKIAGMDSAFMRVHDGQFIRGAKRLYMTATPRIFGEEAKTRAKEQRDDLTIASMDDVETYGPEFFRLGFGEAVERKLLTDYRVVILSVDEAYVTRNFQQELSEDGEIQLGDAARMVGCWNGLAKRFDRVSGESMAPMRRAVAFAQDIKTSKAIAQSFPSIVRQHVAQQGLENATAGVSAPPPPDR